MKFVFALLSTLALALGVQSSVLPWGIPQVVGGGLSYSAVSSPVIAAGPWGSWGGPWGSWGPWGASGISVAGPSVAVAAAPLVGVQGSYVAKTRGAVHAAPLDGHINSVANINVAPAPGTI